MNRPLPVLIILCTVFFSALAGTFAWAATNEVTRTLDVDLDNGELKIELTEDDFDDLEVHWTIEMPVVATTSLNLAVGQLIARVGATELDVNVGVGQASVTAARIAATASGRSCQRTRKASGSRQCSLTLSVT